MSAPLGRGRGRGRGNTLPAWMTRGDDAGGVGSANHGNSNVISNVGGRVGSGGGTDHHRHGRGGGGAPVIAGERDKVIDRRGIREERDRGEPRGYAHDHRHRESSRDRYGDHHNRGRGMERDHHNRERSFRDHHHNHREEDNRGAPPRMSDNNPAAAPQMRGHRGLGFDEKRTRGEREIPWERDRGMGRGRGRGGRVEEMNFVRGETVHDRDRNIMGGGRSGGGGGGNFDRDVGRGERDVRNRDWGAPGERNNIMDRGEHNNNNNIPDGGMGRGRGRGRGANINKPAWMTSGSNNGPVGQHGDNNINSPQKEKDKETMEKLLAQARQLKSEQTKRDDHQRDVYHQKSSSKAPIISQQKDNRKRSNEQIEEEKKQKQRRLEQEEAAKKAEEERKRLERLREEEEQRQLRALVGDLSDNETMMDESAGNKRTEDYGGDLVEFETEEEREERLARKRRDERRKKLRKLEESHGGGREKDDEDMKVDRPRNPAGVIQSELNDNVQRATEASNYNPGTADMKVETTESTSKNGVTENRGVIGNDSGEDSFDIFAADNATPVPTQSSKNAMTTANSKRNTANNAQECDDAEGYYKASIGEIITLPKEKRDDYQQHDNGDDVDRVARFRVLGNIGKGVFSSVIKCVEASDSSNNNGLSGTPPGRIIAMKVIRNNEIMRKAALKEMRILRMLCRKPSKKEGGSGGDIANANNQGGDDEEDVEEQERRERENHNIVRLLDVDPAVSSSATSKENLYSSSAYAAPPPEFRSHCIFLFEFLPFNLREVLSKFGKNVGINLTAVRSYARQLLCALAHLEKHRVVHADLKPDNILVSANFSTVKLADFGSAFFETDHDNDPTPYLVSRFYRPPEVILGLEYDRMVDLWSTSVTLAELFTGTVLFPGKTNNDMLVRFMDTLGPFSHKMVRRHSLSYEKMGLQPHFEVGLAGGTYKLRKHDVDRVTGQPVCRLVNVLSAKADARLAQVLLRASKGGGASERVDVLKFADFLNRCLALDPARRFSVRDALRHDFFIKKKKKEDTLQ